MDYSSETAPTGTAPPRGNAHVELKRIDPLSAGKISGVLYAVGSLFAVPFFLLGGILEQMGPQGGVGPGGVVMLVMAIALPVIYGVMGFLAGILMAFVYNLCAGWIGGFKLELG